MYLHLGQETVVRTKDIIGIFDIENASISKYTKDFLSNATDKGQKLYISQISSRTLLKRAKLGMDSLE